MFQKKYFEYTEMGGGGHGPPWPPRSDGTASTTVFLCKSSLFGIFGFLL